MAGEVSPFVAPRHWYLRFSPNQRARVEPPTCIVLHADASSSIAATLDWLATEKSKASYHVLIGRSGHVYQLVPPNRVAWHAGVSEFEGRANVNAFGIGVSMSNKQDGVEPYWPSQLNACEEVCVELCKHYRIPVDRITTHAEVARPVGRKVDPVKFDLDGFRMNVQQRLRGHTA